MKHDKTNGLTLIISKFTESDNRKDKIIEQLILEKEEMESLVRKEMEGARKLSVPLVVDIGWGKNWNEAH